MITKIPKVLLLLVVCSLPHQELFSQHISRDNHTGNWEEPLTWDPTWSSPQKFISGIDITINGYVTVQSSLGFNNAATKLIINDTLVVKGDLYLHNNNDLIINDQGIVIIRGNLWIDEHTRITANGYLVVSKNIFRDNDHHFGSFISNDNPPRVFIGRSVYPSEITDNFPNYPVLNCSNPITIPYPNSGCSSGNVDDLGNDPIYPFFLSTCGLFLETSKISVCPGDSIHLTATGGIDYVWNGPANFSSEIQNPSLVDADSAMSGIYTVQIMADYDCEATDTIVVVVNRLPAVSISSSDDILCLNDERALIGTPAGGSFNIEEGPGFLADNVLKATDVGEIFIKYLYRDVCSSTDSQGIIVKPRIVVSITSSDDTLCFNDQLTLTGLPAGGKFKIEKGPGELNDNILKATDVGEIFIKYMYNEVCSNTDSQNIVVNPLITVSIMSSNDTLCVNDQRTLIGLPSGGTYKIEKGPGELIDNILKATDAGEIFIKYLYDKMCSNTAGQTIVSIPVPVADAGINQQLNFHFETHMGGNLDPLVKGTWSLVSGKGLIEDIYSPETKITGLSLGENVFLWTVTNGACELASQVTVIVLDVVVPTVFTPNDDGTNDDFYIGDSSYLFEITIFNHWGTVEYASDSYIDHWDGRNNNGNKLAPETYFYVLKLENGQTKKGTVLILN